MALALGTQFKRRFEVCVAARSHEGEYVFPDRSGQHYRPEKPLPHVPYNPILRIDELIQDLPSNAFSYRSGTIFNKDQLFSQWFISVLTLPGVRFLIVRARCSRTIALASSCNGIAEGLFSTCPRAVFPDNCACIVLPEPCLGVVFLI